MSEKAITIGLYAVASGVFTVFMPTPHLAGSSVVRQYLEHDVEAETGGRFLFTDDIQQATQAIIDVLDQKRAALKLAPVMYGDGGTSDAAVARSLASYETPRGVVALGCGHAQSRSQARPPKD